MGRLDEFAVPEVSRDFDARLYARIAREEDAAPVVVSLLWPPVAPVAAAAVAALVMLFGACSKSPDASKQAEHGGDRTGGSGRG